MCDGRERAAYTYLGEATRAPSLSIHTWFQSEPLLPLQLGYVYPPGKYQGLQLQVLSALV